VAKKLNTLWNFIRKLYNININGKPLESPLESKKKKPKKTI